MSDGDEIKERIREAADIVSIISEHVKLKRSGGDFRGPCPFHGGKGPNFSVSAKRQSYHCFVCQESGDVFSFLQKHLGVTFPEALRIAGERSGIEVPQFTPRRSGPDPREPFWEVHATAAEYFRTLLWDDPTGAVARDYLAKRAIDRETADRFGLGFAPREIGVFRAHMATLGFEVERLLEAGLMVQPEEQTEPRPRFRNRLMFPIFDVSGRHVAFGGRTLGDAEPKYLNSPETPVFSKGKLLYALNWAKHDIRRADRLLLVEGYFDVIRLMAAGINTVVAPLGTALTEVQGAAIAKYTRNVFLLYDSDQAGLKATFRAGDELLRHGVAVRVVTFPGGEDPDSFVAAHGPAALEEQLTQAIDVFERKIQILDRGGWFAELQKKRRALDRLFPTIRAASDPLLRDLYVTRAAEKTGVAKDLLLHELSAAAARAPQSDVRGQRSDDEPERGSTSVRSGRSDRRVGYVGRGYSAERELIRAMLTDRSRAVAIAEKVGAESFRDSRYRAIFSVLLSLGEEASVERLADVLEPEDVETLQELLAAPEAQIDAQRTVDDSIADLRGRELDERLDEIDALRPLASGAEKDALIAEAKRLHTELAGLGRQRFKAFRPGRSHRGKGTRDAR